MPFDPISAAVSVGTGLLNHGLSSWAANDTQNRNIDMFNMQHQAAIDDWNRNNAYNSPASQMGRYKEAGLNPNLIYGQMSNSPAVKTPDTSGAVTQPSHVDLSQSLLQGQQIKQSQQQAGLIAAETFKTQQEGISAQSQAKYSDAMTQNLLRNLGSTGANIDASTQKTATEIAMNQQSLGQKSQLFPVQLESAHLQNDKTVAETKNIVQNTLNSLSSLALEKLRTMNDTQRTNLLTQKTPSEIEQLLASASSSRAGASSTNLDSDLKRMNLKNLEQNKPTSHDSPWNYAGRIVGNTLNAVTLLPSQWINSAIHKAANYNSKKRKNNN